MLALRHRLDPIIGVFFLFARMIQFSFTPVNRYIFMFKRFKQRINRPGIRLDWIKLIRLLTESRTLAMKHARVHVTAFFILWQCPPSFLLPF